MKFERFACRMLCRRGSTQVIDHHQVRKKREVIEKWQAVTGECQRRSFTGAVGPTPLGTPISQGYPQLAEPSLRNFSQAHSKWMATTLTNDTFSNFISENITLLKISYIILL